MKTKNWLFSFAFLFCIVFLLGTSCITIPGKVVVDPELPQENSTLVMMSSAINVITYNGIDVSKTWYSNNKPRVNKVTLPAGETTLFFNLRAVFGRGNINMIINIENIEVRYNFEAGKEYTLGVYASNNIGTLFNPRQKLFLAIWNKAFSDANPGGSHNDKILRSWELGEF